jgi:hypothetical protein
MLKQMPKGIVAVGQSGIDVFDGKIGDRILEIHMRLPDG